MANSVIDKDAVIKILTEIMDTELAEVVCHTRSTLMAFGYSPGRR